MTKANKLSYILIFLFSISCLRLCAETIAMSPEKAKEARSTLCAEAKKYIGCPYVYGAHGPDKFDCSGLIYYIAKQSLKINLPRTAKGMYDYADPVKDDKREPGDLVFFKTTSKGIVTHVGIYLGEDIFISALSDGPKRGVVLSSLKETYWSKRYLGTRKFLPSGKMLDKFEDSEAYDVEGLLQMVDQLNKSEEIEQSSTEEKLETESEKPAKPVPDNTSESNKKDSKKPVPHVTPIYEEVVRPMAAIIRKSLLENPLLYTVTMVKRDINTTLTGYNGDFI